MRAWLDRKTLDETRDLLDSLKKDHARRDELRARLEGYDEGLLSLDLDELIDWFEGPGSSILRVLRPSYYRVRGVISGVSKNGTVPETALEDLKTAKELKTVEGELASNRGAVRKALGVYYEGEEPDFEGAERALQTAAKAIRIAGRARVPKE